MAFLMPNKRGEGVLRHGREAEFKPTNEQDMSFCFVLEQHKIGSANHGLWLLHPAVGSDP